MVSGLILNPVLTHHVSCCYVITTISLYKSIRVLCQRENQAKRVAARLFHRETTQPFTQALDASLTRSQQQEGRGYQ